MGMPQFIVVVLVLFAKGVVFFSLWPFPRLPRCLSPAFPVVVLSSPIAIFFRAAHRHVVCSSTSSAPSGRCFARCRPPQEPLRGGRTRLHRLQVPLRREGCVAPRRVAVSLLVVARARWWACWLHISTQLFSTTRLACDCVLAWCLVNISNGNFEKFKHSHNIVIPLN